MIQKSQIGFCWPDLIHLKELFGQESYLHNVPTESASPLEHNKSVPPELGSQEVMVQKSQIGFSCLDMIHLKGLFRPEAYSHSIPLGQPSH